MGQLDAATESQHEQMPTQPARHEARRRALRRYWKVSLILVVCLISVAIILNRDRLQQFQRFGYPGIFLISLIGNATIILPAPSLALVFAMGGALQPPLVGLAAGAGEALGELTGFLAGYGGSAVAERAAAYERIRRLMERYGLFAIFILSVVPNPFFDLAGIAAGVMRIPVWQFLLVCWIGKTIKTMAVAFLGAGSAHLLDQWLM